MTTLHRFIQGIHMKCPKCLIKRVGVLVIENDDQSGDTVAIRVDCSICETKMMRCECADNRKD